MPRTRLELVRLTPHAPQTCAATNYATSAKIRKAGERANDFPLRFSIERTYLLTFAVFAVLVTVNWLVLTTTAVFEGNALAFVSTATLALVFASVNGIGVTSVAVSALVSRTEMLPVSAGIAKSRADSIKTVAAIIVIFDKIVCEPRG